MTKFYYIIANRTSKEVVYYCNSVTQGEQMVPRALSMCRVFQTRAQAKAEIARLQEKWKGLTEWRVNQAPIDWR